MKTITLALGALVATSAIVYLSASTDHEEDNLVAVRPTAQYAPPASENEEKVAPRQAESEKLPAENSLPTTTQAELARAPRAVNAQIARVDIFRALEAPPKPEVSVVEASAPEKPVVVAPKPSFILIGTFRDGDELQAIVQLGENVEFAKLNQVLSGFRVDSIEPAALGWTHQASGTRGILNARGAK